MNTLIEMQHQMHAHPIISAVAIAFFIVVGIAAWGEVPPRQRRTWSHCAGCSTPQYCTEWDGCLKDQGGVGRVHGAARAAGDDTD